MLGKISGEIQQDVSGWSADRIHARLKQLTWLNAFPDGELQRDPNGFACVHGAHRWQCGGDVCAIVLTD
jgi:hypothetical protein